MTINLQEYLNNHLESNPSDAVLANASHLLNKVNALLADPTCPNSNPGVRSGWRPADYNATVPGAAPFSKHISGDAIDLNDDDAALDDWIDTFESQDPVTKKSRNEILEKYGLFREHPACTKTWCHLQQLPPRSNNRTFYP